MVGLPKHRVAGKIILLIIVNGRSHLKMCMKTVLYVLFPLAVLLAVSAAACIFGYAVFAAVDGQWPLRKIITRSTLVFLLLGLFPLAAWLGLNRADFGFARPAAFFKQLLQGLGLGLATLLPVLLALYALDVYVIDVHKTWDIGKTLKALSVSLFLALLISLAEEPLFRGVLLAGLTKKTGTRLAVAASSVYYASLHFLHSKSAVSVADAQWYSGFPMLAEAFANLFSAEIFSAWLALFMVGTFLAVLRSRIPQGLGLCIGCHAAWVWQIKMTKAVFNTDPHAEYAYLVSSYDGVIGPLVAGWMLLAVVGYWGFDLHRPSFAQSKFVPNIIEGEGRVRGNQNKEKR
jgi:membrane protease YdiL (CAAX protease family)